MDTGSSIPIPDQTNFCQTRDYFIYTIGSKFLRGPTTNEAQKAKQKENWPST